MQKIKNNNKTVTINRERILDGSTEETETSEETILNMKSMYVKNSLKVTKDNCSEFFVQHPIFIPSISLTDFALVVKN